MILKKHLPLNSKYFTVLGLAMLPAIVLAQPKVVDKVDKTEGTMQVAPTASVTRYQPKHINAPKLRGAASFNYSLDDTGAAKVRDARKYGDWRFQAFKLGLEGDVQGLGYHVDYAWFRGRLANFITKNDTNTYNHFLETYASHKFHNGVVGQVGNTLVPFGNAEKLTYWQNIPFYAGFGENYQTGLKMIYKDNPWKVEMQLGKASLVAANNANSYTPKLTTGIYYAMDDQYDVGGNNVSSKMHHKNNEDSINLTAKVTRTHRFNEHCNIEVALSGKVGNTYNTISTTRGTMWAGALHVNGHLNNWILQMQYLPYRYSPDFGGGVDTGVAAETVKNTMQLGKDGVLYTIPTKANIISFGLGYKIPLSWDHIKSVTVYDDYSILSGKTTKKNTKLNIMGFKFKAGPLWVMAEAIVGKNMVGIGQNAAGTTNKYSFINNIGGDGYNVNNFNGAGDVSGISAYNDNVDHWKTKFNIHMAIKF
jgi:hypothetical protein